MTLLASLSSLNASNCLVWAGDRPPDGSDSVQETLASTLDGQYAVTARGSVIVNLTHVDTVDRRLRRAGLDLMYSERDQTLGLAGSTAALVEQPAGRMRWPAVLERVPDGPVRAAVKGPVWVRALLPWATSRSRGQRFDVLNDDAKTVARVTWWSSEVESAADRKLETRIGISTLRGYDKDATAVSRLLTADHRFEAVSRSWLDGLRDTCGPPAASRRVDMRSDEPADVAVADVLLGYLCEIESNFTGVIDDIDTEFLHELRVAVRRTRSVLTMVGDVLPEGVAARVAPEFRWLGAVTSPLRDLDVYLLGVDAMAASIANSADLTPFAEHIRRRRSGEHAALARALRSTRFARLRAGWRADLVAVAGSSSNSGITAAQLADQRLRKVFRKVTKRAEAIHADSPAENVHALRKHCKALRYLLELFEPVCDPRVYKQVLGDFKDLQNVLGEFQDGEVQAAALRIFAQEMIESGEVPASALLAMGELSARFDHRQRQARAELTARHSTYLGKRAARHIDRLVLK